MSDIDQLVISTVLREALDAVTSNTDQLAVSLDLDLLAERPPHRSQQRARTPRPASVHSLSS
jgi:arginase family enzyme